MSFMKHGTGIVFALSLVLGAVFLRPAIAQDNRFLVTTDFSATYVDCGRQPAVTVSFYMKNVSDGGISVIVTEKQAYSFQVNHLAASECTSVDFGGIPIQVGRFNERDARREAVYIPKGDGLYVTVRKKSCNCSNVSTGTISNGVVSGNVTVIKGRRILTRPISGRF